MLLGRYRNNNRTLELVQLTDANTNDVRWECRISDGRTIPFDLLHYAQLFILQNMWVSVD